MNTFAKLNLKEQNDIVIVNAPESFEREIASLKGVTVRRSMSDVKHPLRLSGKDDSRSPNGRCSQMTTR